MPQLVPKPSSQRRPTAPLHALPRSSRNMGTMLPDPASVRTALPIMPLTTFPLGRGVNPRPHPYRISIRTTILMNEKVH